MAYRRVKVLPGTGAVTANVRFAEFFTTTLTGNVTLGFTGNFGRHQVIIYVTQDGTGGRTFTIPPAPGGANVNIGAATAINTVANSTTKIILQRINNRNNIVWMGGV